MTRPIILGRVSDPGFKINHQLKIDVWNFAIHKIQASINIALVDSRINRIQKELFAMHRAGTVIGRVDRSAHPLEVTHHVASDSRMDVGTLVKKGRPCDSGHNWLRKVIWRTSSQSLINVG